MVITSVRIEGVSKRFGKTVACDDIHLDVKQGEMFFLLGPSGCGKTTALRIVAGLEKPDFGKIYIDDNDITDLPPFKRPTNLVFQTLALFPHMNVRKNIEYGLKFEQALSASEKERRVKDVIKLVQLNGLEERMMDQLSGGQRQRVAIARALVKEPKVLLLDEPLTALDKKLVDVMKFELRKIQREVGITFLNVTHDQSVTLTMASKIAVMNAGKIVQIGTPEEIYERPNSRFVADFIGEVSGMTAVVESIDGNRVVAEVDGLKMRCRAYDTEGLTVGGNAFVFIRPLDVRLYPSMGHEETRAHLEGNEFAVKINAFTYEGGQYLFEIQLENGKTMRAMSKDPVLKDYYKNNRNVFAFWNEDDCSIIAK